MVKRIVVCCDGTWNTPDQKDRGRATSTNVTKLALAVAPCDASGLEQRMFYDKGVGTGRFDHLRGGAFGFGLSQKVKEAYQFVVANYDPGDELFFFGFSRGAYTARSTVGFIRNVGVLKREYADKLDAAYGLYRSRNDRFHPRGVEASLFRKSFSHETRIKFIGVWDTVGALGIPLTPLKFLNFFWRFHDVKLSTWVDNAYQALAIDEKRRPFKPALWERQPEAVKQTIEQVWFAGVHSNVGGGYEDSGLADVALWWMIQKAQACGLAFDPSYVSQNVKPNVLGQLRNSLTGFYRIWPAYVRPMGRRGVDEALADTAVKRREKDPAYDPPNLREYLASGGTVTPVGM